LILLKTQKYNCL